MKTTFRNKKYTARISNISKTGIEKLRETAIRNANPKDYKRIKFIKSGEFDKRIRQNIRENRFNQNVKMIKSISSQIANTKERQKVVKQLFGEVTTRKNGKPVKYNSFTSLSQTERLKRINKQLKEGTFNIKRYVARSQNYKDVKRYLPTNASIGAVLTALDRTNFYFENRSTIIKHNTNVAKHGRLSAEEMSAGIKLSQEYQKSLNAEDIDFLTSIGKLK